MKNQWLILFFSSFFFFISCTKDKVEINDFKTQKSIKNKSEFLNFIQSLKTQRVPYQEISTIEEFDNYKTLSEKEVKFLSLKNISTDIKEFKIKYKVDISDKFYSIVVVYMINYQELNG